jgi:hypothetical protein
MKCTVTKVFVAENGHNSVLLVDCESLQGQMVLKETYTTSASVHIRIIKVYRKNMSNS